ncbi:MAG TPA: HAMP domain-containing protein [Acetobacteraceae bacterium]|jgi:two-component system sensor histidine kinase UhpB|nr:HAMP domain-containing protein [Acetobacteraceae bacterium]
MPLRVRLIALIGLMLLASLACGSVLVGWHAASSVRTELRAALDVGANTIRNGLGELVHPDDGADELRHLVSTFNGNRHVRATLLDARDQPLAASVLFVPTQQVPGWFRRLIGREPGAIRLAVSPAAEGGGAIVLQADPINEIGEVWAASRDAVLVLAGFALLSALLICAIIGRALRPLENLSSAFEQIGKGDYHGRLPERGPPELTRLARGFNLMTQRLATAAAQNRRLNERLLTLQAEERAELARDLHDEIGPLLFAVGMTAATIERCAGSDRVGDIPTHVRSIHDAVGRVQRHVRAILGRLRPIPAIGLDAAIARLAAFWQSRRPDIAFAVDVSVDEDRIGDDLKDTIYRVVQEAVSNAIRHGNPSCVEIAIAHGDADGIRVEVADDGIGMATDEMAVRGPARLGLIGMRERVMAAAGSLSIQHGRNGRGLALVATLPCLNVRQSQHADAAE